MEDKLINDIVGWDIVNWSKALHYWENKTKLSESKLKCLELGSNQGGLSLWLASKGHQVICSDLENPKSSAEKLHQKFSDLAIKYEAIDATEIPYENKFDVIVFKSILGGISREEQDEKKKIVINQIYKALKPGGILLFAENLEASSLHVFFRKRFVKWGAYWNYLKLEEVKPLLSEFSDINSIAS